MKTLISSLSRLSDGELLARVKDLTRQEREATATVIAHLAEIDMRRLFLPEGCSSMFTYCTQVLSFSERAAYARIEAARAARKYPTILDRLVDGSLNLTAVVLLSPHLTSENHLIVLEEAGGRTRRQVEELVARLRPLPPVAASIRKLPLPKQAVLAVPDAITLDITSSQLQVGAPNESGHSETSAPVIHSRAGPSEPGTSPGSPGPDSSTGARVLPAAGHITLRNPRQASPGSGTSEASDPERRSGRDTRQSACRPG